MSMTKDQIRLRDAAEAFFELPPREPDSANEYRVCFDGWGFWVMRADGKPFDESSRDQSPHAKALVDFMMAALDVGLDKEGTFERYAIERERRREIGKRIDPAKAEVQFCRSIDIDPYHMIPLSEWREECGSYSELAMFARSPGGEWVVSEDLPDATVKALRARQERWDANGCSDFIWDALMKASDKRTWFAPTYEPCDIGVRMNIESHDGAKAGIEFSLEDPHAKSAVKKQLAAFFEA